MTFLLDVNVLIALIDPTHVGHDAAHRWFGATGSASWATCPVARKAAQASTRDWTMSSELDSVHEHMIGLGLGALAHANWHANYHSPDNEYWSQLSVLQAAHACEILIKARIAQEHPLLIFEQLPKAEANEAPLSLQRLVEGGRTYQFADLPDRLWATTGLWLPAADRYRAFGKLRNSIQHFTVPRDVEVSTEAVRFIYEVI